MQTKSHDFAIGGGEYIENGKLHWPDCLTISLPRHRALAIIEQLARALQYPDQEMIELNFFGRLHYDIDEEAEEGKTK